MEAGGRTPREIAKILNTTPANVYRIERTALDRLRQDPKTMEVLREYWSAYIETGAAASRREAKAEPTELLLEYQLEVSEFYKLYERLIGEKLHAEALECLALIEQCQRLIGRELELDL